MSCCPPALAKWGAITLCCCVPLISTECSSIWASASPCWLARVTATYLIGTLLSSFGCLAGWLAIRMHARCRLSNELSALFLWLPLCVRAYFPVNTGHTAVPLVQLTDWRCCRRRRCCCLLLMPLLLPFQQFLFSHFFPSVDLLDKSNRQCQRSAPVFCCPFHIAVPLFFPSSWTLVPKH